MKPPYDVNDETSEGYTAEYQERAGEPAPAELDLIRQFAEYRESDEYMLKPEYLDKPNTLIEQYATLRGISEHDADLELFAEADEYVDRLIGENQIK